MTTLNSTQLVGSLPGILRRHPLGTRGLYLAVLVLGAIPAQAQLTYPATKTGDVSDTYFGRVYNDPYRWLENLKDPDVAAWFKAEAALADDTLAKIPGRDMLVQEWTRLDKLKPATYRSIEFENGRVFYKKTLGGENVGKIYLRQGWTANEKLLFNPDTYKAGVKTTVQRFLPSPDGRYLALSLSAGGAEWSEVRILDVDDGTLLPDSMYPSFGVMSWTLDSTSFLYDAGKVTDIKSNDIQLNRKTRLHVLGKDVASDKDVLSNESNPELGLAPKDLPDASIDETYSDYLLGFTESGQTEMNIFYAPVSELAHEKIAWSVLCDPSDNLVRDIEFNGDYAYAITPAGAPNYRVVRTLVKHPDWKHAEKVISEAKDSIQTMVKTKDFLIILYSNGIVGHIVKYAFATGTASDVILPASGIVSLSCPDWHSNRCIMSMTSWALPTTLFDYDAQTDTFAKSIFNTAVSYPGFENLVSEEVEIPGLDGTMVPLSIIHLKGMALDGKNSCILEGYGAYGFSYEPFFSVLHSIALHGVVVAYAHPRGGSEKGEAWYRGGFKTTKPNTWKDFIACAEYLVKKGYTSPATLAGSGTSAGGILISRAITERPDLFAAAVCNVGCANAMRSEFTPNGPVNTPEFGTVRDPDECAALFEMDGVQHVEKGNSYPAVLGVCGWSDRRVAPWEPGKFVAALQNATTSGKPVLLKVNYDDGHFTEEKTVTFKNFAGQFAFLLWQTGHKEFQPVN